MKYAKAIGRLGGLAIGLGIGATLAASPGIASADLHRHLVRRHRYFPFRHRRDRSVGHE